jgi:hydrogenase maturation protease
LHFVFDSLSKPTSGAITVIVIGVGNEFRRDDAVGLIAVRRLREHGVNGEEHEGDLATLANRWEQADGVILIDAAKSGAPPGTVHRLDVSSAPLDRQLFKCSTHALGLADIIELSRALRTLPARVLVFGVEVRDVSAGIGLSLEVDRALQTLINEVLEHV